MTVPSLTLRDGVQIPQLGFGVFQIDPSDTEQAVSTALEVGYRHIDTAEMYGNEKEVGAAIRGSGVPRDEVFVTSKLNNAFHEPEKAREAFRRTLEALDLGPVDLFLVHWPLPTLYGGDFPATWNTLVEFQRSGEARSVGVSNFQVGHLERLAQESDVLPSVNQVEVHPYFLNGAVRAWGTDHDVVTEAWSPIAQGRVLDDPIIVEIAQRLGRDAGQVVLRWHVQRGDVVFPKSTTPERIASNFQLFDFELSQVDMAAISGLDKGEAGRTGPHPDTFDMVPD